MKSVVNLTPKSFRRAVYSLPYVGYGLKHGLGNLFHTKDREWMRFLSGPRQGMEMKMKLPEENEFYLETHDPQITRFLCHRLRPGGVFVDMGAHIGYYTLLVSRLVGPQGKVFAIEPSPSTAARLSEHLIHNGCRNTYLLELAMADRNGNREFLEFGASTLSGLMPPPNQAPLPREGLTPQRSLNVECRTLDSLVEDSTVSSPDFVKIDVEGLEISALQGMERILDQNKSELLIEMHHPQAAAEVPRLLARKGYHPYRIDTASPTLISGELKFRTEAFRSGVNIFFSTDTL